MRIGIDLENTYRNRFENIGNTGIKEVNSITATVSFIQLLQVSVSLYAKCRMLNLLRINLKLSIFSVEEAIIK